ncbi:serine/threonine-protein kinase [Fibrobacteres bacterium R8-0-B4]
MVGAAGGYGAAGGKLKAADGWDGNGNGTGEFGFSALPGGTAASGSFMFAGSYGFWWTATEYYNGYDNSEAHTIDIMDYDPAVNEGHSTKNAAAFSVRCVEGDAVTPPITPSVEMVSVEGGTFTMGCTGEQPSSDCWSSESPTHSVTLSNYSIGKYEVTQGLWKAVMDTLPFELRASSTPIGVGDNYPIYFVHWDEIVNTFIPKLNQLTGKTYRLPTEAEWEYAARGGNKSKGYRYSGGNNIGEVAWYKDNSGDKPQIVGTKLPNELGIYDMSGNVFEWVSDWYSESYYGSSPSNNPTGPAESGSPLAVRGKRGCYWNYDAERCRVSSREWDIPDYRRIYNGFRLAQTTQVGTPPGGSGSYQSVTIGGQRWMKKNLDIATADSWCYDGSADSCAKYGRLYTWEAAKTACPRGWHLPTNEEWYALIGAAITDVSAGKALKSSSGWNGNGNGTDDYGFSALPGGWRDVPDGPFRDIGNIGYWWTATEVGGGGAVRRGMYYFDVDALDEGGTNEDYGLSVRCVAD